MPLAGDKSDYTKFQQEVGDLYIKHYKSLLMKYRNQYTLSLEEAQDLLNETFKIYIGLRQKESYNNTRYKPSTLLHSISQNLILSSKHKAKMIVLQDSIDQKYIAKDISELQKLELLETNNLVIKAIKSLGQVCQKIIKLWSYKEWSNEQIANELGFKSTNALAIKKTRCLKKLKSLIGDDNIY